MDLNFVCEHCRGAAVLYGTAACPFCHGLAATTFITPTSGYYHAVDILGCIDFAEFNALGDVNKTLIQMILSAGYVDMREGSAAMIKLYMCFPEGTATCAKLLALTGA